MSLNNRRRNELEKYTANQKSNSQSQPQLIPIHNIGTNKTLDDYKAVKDLGVDAGQGYFFRKPEPHIDANDGIIAKIECI